MKDSRMNRIQGYFVHLIIIVGFASLISISSQTSFNSYFEYKSNTMVLNEVAEGHALIFTSTTLLQCVIHCQEHRCTSLVHDKNTNEGGCTIYKLPLKELRYSSSDANFGKDTLVIKPCAHQNTNCLHGGVCTKNVSSIKGYDCNCIGEWTGEICEKGNINFLKLKLAKTFLFFN